VACQVCDAWFTGVPITNTLPHSSPEMLNAAIVPFAAVDEAKVPVSVVVTVPPPIGNVKVLLAIAGRCDEPVVYVHDELRYVARMSTLIAVIVLSATVNVIGRF